MLYRCLATNQPGPIVAHHTELYTYVLCREIVSQLSSVGTNVVALARNASAARQKLPMANVDVVEGDLYQYATLPNALQNCDAVICAAGFNDMLDPLGPFKVDYTVRTCPCQPARSSCSFLAWSTLLIGFSL